MTVYAPTARFDSARALTTEELYAKAPSVFARDSHYSRSDRFAVIPTIEIVKGLADEGFAVVGATQSVARQADKKPYTKHLLRLRRLNDGLKYSVGGSVMEILLENANDGSSAYRLMAGMFRIQCMNSLVCQTSTIDEVRVRHSGNAITKVIEGSYEILKSADMALKAPADWSQIQLSDQHRRAFAVGAHTERFADAHGVINTTIKPEQLLIPRRPEDTGRDLWSTFNVIQENAIKGGLASVTETHRRSTSREVKGIDQSIKLNRGLWAMADWLARRVA
jgi:Domain of unknown function (DUF932)